VNVDTDGDNIEEFCTAAETSIISMNHFETLFSKKLIVLA